MNDSQGVAQWHRIEPLTKDKGYRMENIWISKKVLHLLSLKVFFALKDSNNFCESAIIDFFGTRFGRCGLSCR